MPLGLAVLKSHSELILEYLNTPWLLLFLLEQEIHGELNSAYLVSSMHRYWRYSIRDNAEHNVSPRHPAPTYQI